MDAFYRYGAAEFAGGNLEQTARLWERVVALDPDNRRTLGLLTQVYVSLGRDEDAERYYGLTVDACMRHLELYPDDYRARLEAAASYAGLGRMEEAMAVAQPVLDSGVQDTVLLYNTACFFSMAGEIDQALDMLERAFEGGFSDGNWVRQDSELDNIRDHPATRCCWPRWTLRRAAARSRRRLPEKAATWYEEALDGARRPGGERWRNAWPGTW